MIRLTVHIQSEPEIHLFNKSIISMGSEAADVDLILPGVDIQPLHLQIIDQNGFIVLVNEANDPFVSVNGHPFGKKLLNSGDLILVHETTILFERLKTTFNDPVPCEPAKEKDKQAEEFSVPSSLQQSFTLPFEEGEVEVLKEEEWRKIAIDDYLKDFVISGEEAKYAGVHTRNQSVEDFQVSAPQEPHETKLSRSLKDDYLKDLEDDHPPSGAAAFTQGKSHLYQAWKSILLFIFSLFALTGIICTAIYFTVSDKTEAQETKAARAVADVAMALTYAQFDHLKPNNQNWSDVDFIKSNLQAILGSAHSHAFQIDAQGQLNCCPYSLRVYTSSDLSHFLLIAQPAPSLLYWLFPKSIIVVDSHSMELRAVTDVRGLNRLLANPDPLEGSNGNEITALVKEGGLIRLSSLAYDSGQPDFAPPKNLAWVKPGAENYIYNSPRYYRLGQNLVQKAKSLSTSKGSSQEVATLKQEVENMSCLNDLIIYCDQGKKSALLARQGIMMFAPTDKMLFGYLNISSQGKIDQANLLKEDDELDNSLLLSLNLPQEKEEEVIAFQPPSEMIGKQKKEEEKLSEDDRFLVDSNHPIYIQLQALANARENELKTLTAALHEMIDQELHAPRSQFQTDFQNLSHTYLIANAKHKRKIKGALDILYHQYEDLPVSQFLAFAKELKLDKLIQKSDNFSMVDENSQENIKRVLAQIETSKHLTELDSLVQIANAWLNFDYIQDTEELMKYQTQLRNRLLEKLEQFLLWPDKHLAVKADDRLLIQHILGHERLIQAEERDYFLAEFDELLASQENK